MLIKLSVPRGNAIELLGLASGVAILFFVPPLPGELLLWSWTAFWYFPHCLTHYVVGTVLGMKFTHYVVGKSNLTEFDGRAMCEIAGLLPTLGLRIDKMHESKVHPARRAAMYASGAVSSMFLPMIPTFASISRATPMVSVLLLFATLGNLALTLYSSPKIGDFARAMKTLRNVSTKA